MAAASTDKRRDEARRNGRRSPSPAPASTAMTIAPSAARRSANKPAASGASTGNDVGGWRPPVAAANHASSERGSSGARAAIGCRSSGASPARAGASQVASPSSRASTAASRMPSARVANARQSSAGSPTAAPLTSRHQTGVGDPNRGRRSGRRFGRPNPDRLGAQCVAEDRAGRVHTADDISERSQNGVARRHGPSGRVGPRFATRRRERDARPFRGHPRVPRHRQTRMTGDGEEIDHSTRRGRFAVGDNDPVVGESHRAGADVRCGDTLRPPPGRRELDENGQHLSPGA